MTSTNDTHLSWSTLSKDESFHRANFACGEYKDRYLIIAGGANNHEKLSSALLYDACTQQHIVLPNLPFSGECGGDVLDGNFYVFELHSGKMYRLNLSEQSNWVQVASIRKKDAYNNVISDTFFSSAEITRRRLY